MATLHSFRSIVIEGLIAIEGSTSMATNESSTGPVGPDPMSESSDTSKEARKQNASTNGNNTSVTTEKKMSSNSSSASSSSSSCIKGAAMGPQSNNHVSYVGATFGIKAAAPDNSVNQPARRITLSSWCLSDGQYE
jgi:hypothetical protein